MYGWVTQFSVVTLLDAVGEITPVPSCARHLVEFEWADTSVCCRGLREFRGQQLRRGAC